LKTALEISEAEKQNLKTTLQETNQQIDNLSSALAEAQSKIQNLSTNLEETNQQLEKLKTGKIVNFNIGETIGEAEALDHYRIGRNILRRPREKGKTTVSFTTNDISVTLEYLGQPEGKGKQHFWKIVDQTNQLSIS
jgi:DNA repair exonuclease SbcCD ATPase subunit